MTTSNHEEWIVSAKNALEWFIESMGQTEWHRRRRKVVDYFHSLKENIYTETEIQSRNTKELFSPIAVYDDWMSWYMYLVEAVFERQGCDDPFQSARVYPFFATIGRNVNSLKKMQGVEQRIKFMLNEKQNQPDSSLFELVIAALYHRNGWFVEFLKEHTSNKTPDLKITRKEEQYWVECKRLAKSTDYANLERIEWQKRAKHLMNVLRLANKSAYIEIIFKVPIEDTSEYILSSAFMYCQQSGKFTLQNAELDLKVHFLDLSKINDFLLKSPTRPNSPHMIEALTGNYDLHGNYMQLIGPSQIETVCPDNELYILNDFVAGLYETYIAKWDCIAKKSIDKKAKDIKKVLSNASKQIPDIGNGIIHIGYETVSGPLVEVQRQQKIQEIIETFNFGSKKIASIYCNAMQLLPKIGGFEWAETTLLYEVYPGAILNNTLLLDMTETESRDDTHWFEDLLNRMK
ncbi:MAG: hypothetical protein AB2L20_07140 [Mangrovibacterium sp.]